MIVQETYGRRTLLALLRERYLDHALAPSRDQVVQAADQVARLAPGRDGSRCGLDLAYRESADRAALEQALVRVPGTEIGAALEAAAVLERRLRQTTERTSDDLVRLLRTAADHAIDACSHAQAALGERTVVHPERFATVAGLDLSTSDVAIDLDHGAVRLLPAGGALRVDLRSLPDRAFTVHALDARTAGSIRTLAPARRMLDDGDGGWRIWSPAPAVAFDLDLGSTVRVTRIRLLPSRAGSIADLEVRLLGSADGLTWRELAVASGIASTVVDAVLPATRLSRIRIEQRRTRPTTSDDPPLYEFGLDSIALEEQMHRSRGRLRSRPIPLVDADGEAVRVREVTLEASDVRPAGCTLRYTLEATLENGAVVHRAVEPGATVAFAPAVRIERDGVAPYRQIHPGRVALAHALEEGYRASTVEVFRNLYQPGIKIDGVPSGWAQHDGRYHCWFELRERRTLYFGPLDARLDGRPVRGTVEIEPGWHAFSTRENHWRDADSTAEDPLYPYNHKRVIEGAPDDEAYVGADLVAAWRLVQVAAHDLLHRIEIPDTRYFALSSGRPVLGASTTTDGWRYERHAVRYDRLGPNDPALAEVRILAELASDHPALTPTLHGYLVLAV